MTMLLVDDPIPLQVAVDQLRNHLSYPPSVEFHFAKSSNAVREQFLRTIAPLRFDIRAVITDKQLMLPPQLQKQETFYRYLIRLGLAYNLEAIRDALIIMDESVQSKRAKHDFRVALRKALNTDPARPVVKSITYHRSPHSSHGYDLRSDLRRVRAERPSLSPANPQTHPQRMVLACRCRTN